MIDDDLIYQALFLWWKDLQKHGERCEPEYVAREQTKAIQEYISKYTTLDLK